MDLGTSCVKLTGNPDASGWAQDYDFFPQEAEKQIRRGHLYVVFSAGKENVDLESAKLGRECLQRIHEEYFGNLEKEAHNALKDTVSKVYEEFKRFLQHFEISAVSVIGNNIYAASVNGGKVILQRGGFLVRILDSSTESTILANGYAKEGDLLILATSSFIEGVGNSELRSALGGGMDSILENLAALISSDGNSGKKGVLVIGFFGKLGKTLEELDAQDVARDEGVEKEEVPTPKAKRNIFRNLKNIIPVRKITIRRPMSDEVPGAGRKTPTLIVGLVLLALLGVSIVFGLNRKKQTDYKSSYESDLVRAVEFFEESQKILSLDPARAREMFIESRGIATSLNEREIKDQTLTDLTDKLKNEQGKVLGEYLVEPELFLDLTLLSDGFSADEIAVSDGQMYVLSRSSDRLVSIDFETKKSESLLSSDDVKGSKTIASYFGNVYLLKEEGVYQEDDGDIERVVESDFGEGFLYSFASNLYFLDKEGRITKFSATETGFSNGSDWLSENTDLSDVVSWAFDGSIWVLESDGGIRRFSLGNELTFTTKGVPFEINDGKSIYTDEDLEEIYVLVPDLKRVVVFDKEGVYRKYYESETFFDAKAVVVVENSIVVMTSEKLWKFEIE